MAATLITSGSALSNDGLAPGVLNYYIFGPESDGTGGAMPTLTIDPTTDEVTMLDGNGVLWKYENHKAEGDWTANLANGDGGNGYNVVFNFSQRGLTTSQRNTFDLLKRSHRLTVIAEHKTRNNTAVGKYYLLGQGFSVDTSATTSGIAGGAVSGSTFAFSSNEADEPRIITLTAGQTLANVVTTGTSGIGINTDPA